MVYELCTIQLKIGLDFRSKERIDFAGNTLIKLLSKFENELPLFDPIKDMEIDSVEVKIACSEIERLQKLMNAKPKPN